MPRPDFSKCILLPYKLYETMVVRQRWRMPTQRPHISYRLTALISLSISFWLILTLYNRISHHNQALKDTRKWASFLAVLRGAVPDFSTLTFDAKGPFLGFDNANESNQRLDTVHLAEKSFKITKAAHELVVAVIPEYEVLGNYRLGTRGIVTVGGGIFTPVVLITLRMLRRKGSILPVEVFIPEHENFDPYFCDTVLPTLNARCITRPKFDEIKVSKYQYKVFALLFSSFEDVLFIDADSIPIIDPSEYFISEPFISTGLVTWPDFWISSVSPVYYDIVGQGVPGLLERPTTEAGQMLFSKRKHSKTILLAIYYNLHGPSIYYKLLSQGAPGEGDKDTFLAAASVFYSPFYQVSRKPDVIGYVGENRHKGFQGLAMLQRHPGDDFRKEANSRVAFIHQNAVKLNPKGLVGRLDSKRMWGSKGDTVEKFGYDLEGELWQEIVHVACEYGKGLWWNSGSVCKGVKRFWNGILEKEMTG